MKLITLGLHPLRGKIGFFQNSTSDSEPRHSPPPPIFLTLSSKHLSSSVSSSLLFQDKKSRSKFRRQKLEGETLDLVAVTVEATFSNFQSKQKHAINYTTPFSDVFFSRCFVLKGVLFPPFDVVQSIISSFLVRLRSSSLFL